MLASSAHRRLCTTQFSGGMLRSQEWRQWHDTAGLPVWFPQLPRPLSQWLTEYPYKTGIGVRFLSNYTIHYPSLSNHVICRWIYLCFSKHLWRQWHCQRNQRIRTIRGRPRKIYECLGLVERGKYSRKCMFGSHLFTTQLISKTDATMILP